MIQQNWKLEQLPVTSVIMAEIELPNVQSFFVLMTIKKYIFDQKLQFIYVQAT
jgi:hypothetical protein